MCQHWEHRSVIWHNCWCYLRLSETASILISWINNNPVKLQCRQSLQTLSSLLSFYCYKIWQWLLFKHIPELSKSCLEQRITKLCPSISCYWLYSVVWWQNSQQHLCCIKYICGEENTPWGSNIPSAWSILIHNAVFLKGQFK